MTDWVKVEGITAILTLVFAIIATGLAGWAAYTSNELNNRSINIQQQGLEMQKIAEGFDPIVFSSAKATLGTIDYTKNMGHYVTGDGTLDISITAISPHIQIINFSLIELGDLSQPFNFEVSNQTLNGYPIIDLTYGGMITEYYGLSGIWNGKILSYPQAVIPPASIDSVNFTIPLHFSFLLNRQLVNTFHLDNNSSGRISNALLGTITGKGYLYDAQIENGTIITVTTNLYCDLTFHS